MARVQGLDITFDQLAADAMSILANYYHLVQHGKKVTSEQIAAAKIAQGTVSAWTRNRASRSAEAQLAFLLARELASPEGKALRGLLPPGLLPSGRS